MLRMQSLDVIGEPRVGCSQGRRCGPMLNILEIAAVKIHVKPALLFPAAKLNCVSVAGHRL